MLCPVLPATRGGRLFGALPPRAPRRPNYAGTGWGSIQGGLPTLYLPQILSDSREINCVWTVFEGRFNRDECAGGNRYRFW